MSGSSPSDRRLVLLWVHFSMLTVSHVTVASWAVGRRVGRRYGCTSSHAVSSLNLSYDTRWRTHHSWMPLIARPILQQQQQQQQWRRLGHSLAQLSATSDRRDDHHHNWRYDDRFLHQTETTVDRVVQSYATHNGVDILQEDRDHDILFSLPTTERQVVGIVRHLHMRLQAFRTNKDCRRCWLQQAHCICPQIQPLDHLLPPSVRTIFLLTHHKEICMAIDTAKLILASFADASRLVIAGIPGEYQDSMSEMMEAISSDTIPTLVLFPSDGSLTFETLLPTLRNSANCTDEYSSSRHITEENALQFNVIVLDGTWEQARRMYNRYISPYNVTNVQLSVESLSSLNTNNDKSLSASKQLRRHPVPIREIATAHALQLLLQDIAVSTMGAQGSYYMRFASYIQIANAAAVVQLGPTRPKLS